MKRVDKNWLKGSEEEKYYKNEKIILPKLQSPLVCRCYTIFEDDNYLYYVMEFMNNGDLLSYYMANRSLQSKIPEDKLWDLFFKCISGILYIHNQGIIHRDIKLANLFLDDNFNIKIGDFNISAAINQESAGKFTNDYNQMKQLLHRNSNVGTPGFMPPEACGSNRKYDQKADVYAMGISFYFLAYGKKGKNSSENNYSEELDYIIDKMTEKNFTKRFTSKEAYSMIKKFFGKMC